MNMLNFLQAKRQNWKYDIFSNECIMSQVKFLNHKFHIFTWNVHADHSKIPQNLLPLGVVSKFLRGKREEMLP